MEGIKLVGMIRDSKLSNSDESEMYSRLSGDLQAYFKLLLDEVENTIDESKHPEQIINDIGNVFDKPVGI